MTQPFDSEARRKTALGWLKPVPPLAPSFGSGGAGLTRLWTQIKRVGNSFPTLSILALRLAEVVHKFIQLMLVPRLLGLRNIAWIEVNP